jgi:type I site-specific restriction endonuclease
MTQLNAPFERYPERLIQNMTDLSDTIQQHLLNKESILRPKQREAISETIRKIQEEKSRAVAMIMPTATGKMVIVSRMLAGLTADKRQGAAAKKVIFVCDGIEGVKQARDKMLHYAGINHSRENRYRQINVAGYF